MELENIQKAVEAIRNKWQELGYYIAEVQGALKGTNLKKKHFK